MGLAVDGADNLLIADRGNYRVRLLSPAGMVSTFAGRDRRDPFGALTAVAVGGDGSVFVAQANALFKVDQAGKLSTVLETPLRGEGSLLSDPGGIAVAPDGALYVTERYFQRVLRITLDGEVSVVAGRPEPQWGVGDVVGGPPWDVKFFYPEGILVDADGDLLVSDQQVGVIWKIPFE